MNADTSTSGFPPALAVHLAGSLRTARRRYAKRLARSQRKFSEKSVHELRVETRRMLALLDLLEAIHFEDTLKKLRKTFKRRLDAFDDLRDTQVQLRLLKPLWPDFPEARDFRRLLCKSERRLISCLRREIKVLKQRRLERRLKDLEKRLSTLGQGTPSPADSAPAARALGEAFARVMDWQQQVRPGDAAAIHRMRVAFKRFRYMSELLCPFFPELNEARLREMHGYQAAAGDIQDAETLLARLGQCVAAGELTSPAVRNLRREVLKFRRRVLASFMKNIDQLAEFDPCHFKPVTATRTRSTERD